MTAEELLESVNSPTPSMEGILESLFAQRYSGSLHLVLHFHGGRVQVLEVLESTKIRVVKGRPVDTNHRE